MIWSFFTLSSGNNWFVGLWHKWWILQQALGRRAPVLLGLLGSNFKYSPFIFSKIKDNQNLAVLTEDLEKGFKTKKTLKYLTFCFENVQIHFGNCRWKLFSFAWRHWIPENKIKKCWKNIFFYDSISTNQLLVALRLVATRVSSCVYWMSFVTWLYRSQNVKTGITNRL